MVLTRTVAGSTVIGPAMDELAAALSPVLGPEVTVYSRPVDKVIAPAVVLTVGEPTLSPGGTHGDYELHLVAAVIAGRFDAASTFDMLLAIGETVFETVWDVPGTMPETMGRVGPVTVAGVDYLAGLIDMTVYRN